MTRLGKYDAETATGGVDVSVVVPIYNEKHSLMPLVEELLLVFDRLPYTFEIVLVDDRSSDGSGAICARLAKLHDKVMIVQLPRHEGQSVALAVGLAYARGQFLITMDADLQDVPAEIPRFIQGLQDGYDVVCGWKRERHDSWFKIAQSRIFNGCLRSLTGLPLRDSNCGFRALRREVAGLLPLYGGMHRFVPLIAYLVGFRVTELPVHHRPRKYGNSKYGTGLGRIPRAASDLLTVLLFYGSRRRWDGLGFLRIRYVTFACVVLGLVMLGIVLGWTPVVVVTSPIVARLVQHSTARRRETEIPATRSCTRQRQDLTLSETLNVEAKSFSHRI